jgi:hypothetical protein
MSMMYVTHPYSPKAVGTRLADRIGIAIPRKNGQGKKLALVKVWYFSVFFTW